MSSRAEMLKKRAQIIRAIRTFFESRGFVEVDTPVAQQTLAPEAHIEAPAVMFATPKGPQQRFLQTSPELLMKEILANDLPLIFQIAPCFRDGDHTRWHRPEFRLLEWYRRDATWQALVEDCEELLMHVAKAVGAPSGVSLTRPFRRYTMDEAFKTHAGFSILEAETAEALRREARKLGITIPEDEGWEDAFHRVFLTAVEPKLTQDPTPFFLTGFPAKLAALARLSDEDPRVSERFEMYVGGMELANGFGELVDPREQGERFIREAAIRQEAGKHRYPPATRFLASLGKLQSAAGIALGIERLLMFFLEQPTIDAVWAIDWDVA